MCLRLAGKWRRGRNKESEQQPHRPVVRPARVESPPTPPQATTAQLNTVPGHAIQYVSPIRPRMPDHVNAISGQPRITPGHGVGNRNALWPPLIVGRPGPSTQLTFPTSVQETPGAYFGRYEFDQNRPQLRARRPPTKMKHHKATPIGSHFRVLDLPAELREHIFKLVTCEERFSPSYKIDSRKLAFVRPRGTIYDVDTQISTDLNSYRQPAVTQVNQQFRRESLPLYLQQRTMLLVIRIGADLQQTQALPDMNRYRPFGWPWPDRLLERFEFRIFHRGAQSSPKLTIDPCREGGYRIRIWRRVWMLQSGRFVPTWTPHSAPTTMLTMVQQIPKTRGTFLTPRDLGIICVEFCWWWRSGLLDAK